jgi:hypothetical protein
MKSEIAEVLLNSLERGLDERYAVRHELDVSERDVSRICSAQAAPFSATLWRKLATADEKMSFWSPATM